MQHGRTAGVFGVILGAGIGFGTLHSASPHEGDATASIEPAHRRREYPRTQALPTASDPGVMASVRALVEPAYVDDDGKGERLFVHVLVENQLSDPAIAQYALEIADDRGHARRSISESTTLRMTPHGRVDDDVLGVPAGLPDGYYKLDLVVAAAGRSGSGVVIEPLYVQVQAGEVHPLTLEEFYTESNANLEVTHAPRR